MKKSYVNEKSLTVNVIIDLGEMDQLLAVVQESLDNEDSQNWRARELKTKLEKMKRESIEEARREFEDMLNAQQKGGGGYGPRFFMGYRVFTRTWWKENPDWPDGLEPKAGRKRYRMPSTNWKQQTFATEKEAIAWCKEWNDTHEPGRYSRKAEFEET